MNNKLQLKIAVFSAIIMIASNTYAHPDIKLFSSKGGNTNVPMTTIKQIVDSHFKVNDYRQITVQVIRNQKQQPDHLLVYLFAKKYHRVDVARIDVDARYQVINAISHYRLSTQDFQQQPGITNAQATCPDPSTQFIAFAPNADTLEQEVTVDVANSAKAHSLKTIKLLEDDATRTNYLNYMKCPKLVGNFYDGDANQDFIVTVDGVISANDISQELMSQFHYKVTNIWLACEAFNDPIKSSVIDVAQAQKYAAGINNLIVGPSDYTAACAMKAAIDGKPMTAAFHACYEQFDDSNDLWGFDGKGADIFSV